jgi:CO/xanthine dehydrogenase Mo-binding subunit
MSGLETQAFVLTRRTFFGIAGAGGVTVLHHRLAFAATSAPGNAAPAEQAAMVGVGAKPHWSAAPGKARFRIEGLPKVTGQKIYARDFRTRDMLGWPTQERVALVLRAHSVDRLFLGLDLSMLSADLQPLRAITQADLLRDNITLPFGYSMPAQWPSGLLVPQGTRPVFYGQPIAILLFASYDVFRRAKRLLQFNPQVVQYDSKTAAIPVANDPYQPTTYLTRYAQPGQQPFSQVQDGHSDPYSQAPTAVDQQAIAAREKIALEFGKPGLRSFGGSYSTQVLDPMFMEPEAGLAWLQQDTQRLHLVLGTQATNGDMGDTLGLFANPQCPVKVCEVVLNACYPGGGFGGRDVSTFPPLLALAAAYAQGQPVRIALDRYEQFQSGLKQLDSHIAHSIAVDARGKFKAFKSSQQLHGGGMNNYSQFVAALAGYCGLSGYNIDKAQVDAVAMPSAGVVSGSMRGFGGPQASFAVESLIDEVAQGLGMDAISLRERNVLHTGDRTITGAPVTQDMKLAQICHMARAHGLWKHRAREQHRHAKDGMLYGVGFALANQAYGTGTDGVMAGVEIDDKGRMTVRTNCVDMGNGSATTLAISTAQHAGSNAAHIVMGDAAYFDPLGFQTAPSCPVSVVPPVLRQGRAVHALAHSDASHWEQPNWTASYAMSSSACLTAFHQVHVTEQATRVLFESALLPAAAQLWGVPVQTVRGATHWRDGRLHAPGLRGLPLPDIARQLHASGLPCAAMVHGLYQGRWVAADYTVGAWSATLPVDLLSTRPAGSATWQQHWRSKVQPPDPQAALYGRSLFSPSGALVAVGVDRASGRARVLAVELMVDAGKVLQPDLLSGQAQGGIAMGIGYALLENLPLVDHGAGDGRWNLDRYHVPLAGDLPLGRIGLTVLPTQESTAKGIAEAVLCPIAPAIANAIAHATGARFRHLPITAAQIKEVLA